MFGQILKTLQESDLVRDFELTELVEEESLAFLKMKVTLFNESFLFIKEVVFKDGSKYSYHWQDQKGNLIRWDNSPHWSYISTYPDHKHIGKDVLPSYRVFIEDILKEIQERIASPSQP